MRAWTFTDLTTSAVYTFPHNPREMGTPYSQRLLVTHPGSSATTKQPAQYPEWTFAGRSRGQTMHDSLSDWMRRSHRIEVCDHLERIFTILPIGIEFSDRRSGREPWLLDYTAKALLVIQHGGAA